MLEGSALRIAPGGTMYLGHHVITPLPISMYWILIHTQVGSGFTPDSFLQDLGIEYGCVQGKPPTHCTIAPVLPLYFLC